MNDTANQSMISEAPRLASRWRPSRSTCLSHQHAELNGQHGHSGFWLRLSLRLLQCFRCPGISHIPQAHACHIQLPGFHTHPCHVFPHRFTAEERRNASFATALVFYYFSVKAAQLFTAHVSGSREMPTRDLLHTSGGSERFALLPLFFCFSVFFSLSC